MKYIYLVIGMVCSLSVMAQNQTPEDFQLKALEALLEENRITQLEFNQSAAKIQYRQQQQEMEQFIQSRSLVVNRLGGTASISGTVTAVDPENISISLCTFNVYNCIAFTSTDASGDYSFNNIPADNYLVVANDDFDDYINAIWSITGTEACQNNCQIDADNQITLADAEARVGVDLTLTLGASISGNVFTGSTGIENAYVSLRNIDRTFFGGANTDAAGDYSIKGLPADDYYLQIQNYQDVYIDAMWSDVGTVQCSNCVPDADSTLTLAAAENRAGIDFDLIVGATITGHIVDQTSLAEVATLDLRLYDPLDVNFNWFFSTDFDGAGNYSISGLPQGNYVPYLDPRSDGNLHIPEIYNNIQCNACYTLLSSGSGDVVNLSNGATTANIDFNVELGASISGIILNNDYPLETVKQLGLIFVFNDSNRLLNSLVIYGTDYEPLADGTYQTGGLLPGMYFVQGGDLGREFFQRELFENIACPWSGCDRGGGGDPVVLGDGEQRLGVNFLLNYGGKIAGTVTDQATGLPISPELNEYVQFYNAAGEVAGGSEIRPDGTYLSRRALPPGTYSVRTGSMFSGVFISPYVMEKYDSAGNIDCPGVTCDLTTGNVNVVAFDPLDATPEDSATVTGIDFALSTGFSFSGTITELGSADPIPDVHVLVYNDNGDFANWATTDASGDFTVHGLPAGTYYALTNNGSNLPFMGLNQTEAGGWIDILFNGQACPGSACDVTTGDPIELGAAPRGTVGPAFNFTMVSGGTITGQVRNFDSQLPASGVEINVYNASGDFYGSYVTDNNGYYLTVGFPEGTYYLTSFNNGALLDGKYGGGYCIDQSCNPLDATPIVIVGEQAVVGADFQLRPDFIYKNGLD